MLNYNNDALETYPFKGKNSDMPVIRHKNSKKWFALIFYLEKTLYINLKCNPYDAQILRDLHPYITSAWHMNKSHWNKIDVNKAPRDLLKNLIKASFDLTK